jgi:DNA processing protein
VRRQRFLSRNRLIAALTRATVVVEAAERSGTMTTATAALAMNRPLLAVPGPVTSPASAGCHRMVRDGAALLAASVDDVLGVLDVGHQGTAPERRVDDRDVLPAAEQRILDVLPGRGASTLDEIARRSGIPARQVLALLGSLEAGGWLAQDSAGWRLVRRRTPARGRRA